MESEEKQEDMMKQALALAVQLNVAMEDNGSLIPAIKHLLDARHYVIELRT